MATNYSSRCSVEQFSAIEIFNRSVDSGNCHSTDSVGKILQPLNLNQENNHDH